MEVMDIKFEEDMTENKKIIPEVKEEITAIDPNDLLIVDEMQLIDKEYRAHNITTYLTVEQIESVFEEITTI